MGFARSLLASAAIIAYALAESVPVAFTSVPAAVVAGSFYNITWGGGDGVSAVTLTLRKGDPNNLNTIGVIADSVTNDYYVWLVPDNLVAASDYALQITQGQSDINYSGLFSVIGGSGSSSVLGLATSTASTSSNSSSTVTSTGAAGVGTVGSMGTGTALPRNTTFSSATMSSTPSVSAGTTLHAATSTAIETTTAAATSSEPSASQTTSAPNSGGAAQLGSSAALVMGLFAAIMCLQ